METDKRNIPGSTYINEQGLRVRVIEPKPVKPMGVNRLPLRRVEGPGAGIRTEHFRHLDEIHAQQKNLDQGQSEAEIINEATEGE